MLVVLEQPIFDWHLHGLDYPQCSADDVVRMQINALQSQNQRLMAHVGEVEAHKSMLTGQVSALRNKWTTASSDNMRLQAELSTLHKSLQVCRNVGLNLLLNVHL